MAAASPLAFAMRGAEAATPNDTVVFASQIDDVITCDPGEAYEISAQIFLSSVYDRLVRYEAEDMTKLVGGVAEGWSFTEDAKTYTKPWKNTRTFTLRPDWEMMEYSCEENNKSLWEGRIKIPKQ